MRAMLLEAPRGAAGLRLADLPDPLPAVGEVRVRLKASALNRRDHTLAAGNYPGAVFPCVLGSDGAGVIDAVGEGVDGTAIGREVMIYPARDWGADERCFDRGFRVLGMPDQGTFAELICVPATDVVARPAHLSWEAAAAIPLAGLTAWRAVVTQGEVGPGHKVLVSGAGSGVSTFAILWAVRLGAEVWVTSGSADKIAAAIALGAAGGQNYREDGWETRLRKQSGGFDVVIDSAGGDGIHRLLGTLRPAGRYVFFGATLGNSTQPLDLDRVFLRQLRIQGTTMGSPREFAAMVGFVADREIVPVIDQVLPLDRLAAGLALMEGYGQQGKIVFTND